MKLNYLILSTRVAKYYKIYQVIVKEDAYLEIYQNQVLEVVLENITKNITKLKNITKTKSTPKNITKTNILKGTD